jgi:hypothetical protein
MATAPISFGMCFSTKEAIKHLPHRNARLGRQRHLGGINLKNMREVRRVDAACVGFVRCQLHRHGLRRDSVFCLCCCCWYCCCRCCFLFFCPLSNNYCRPASLAVLSAARPCAQLCSMRAAVLPQPQHGLHVFLWCPLARATTQRKQKKKKKKTKKKKNRELKFKARHGQCQHAFSRRVRKSHKTKLHGRCG